MAGRTDALTDIAKPVADRLSAHCGSLKRILSAGVLALDALPPEERERFMAAAIGAYYESSQCVQAKNAILVLKQIIEDAPAGDITKIASPEVQQLLRSLIPMLAPPTPPKKLISQRHIGQMNKTG